MLPNYQARSPFYLKHTIRGNSIEISLYLASERSERDTIRGNSIEISLYLLASERSERDTYRGNTIENRGCLFIYLFIYMDVRMSSRYCVSYVVDPVPNCTKQNPLVYRSVPVSPGN